MPLLTELETLYDFGCHNYAAPYDAPARRLNREPAKTKNKHSALRTLHSALEREIVDFEEELAGAKN